MARASFLSGDPVPWFYAASDTNPNYCFDPVAGRYFVVSFFGSNALEKAAAVLNHVTGPLRGLFDDENISFFGVSIDRRDKAERGLREMLPGIRFFWDYDLRISALYGATDPIEERVAGGVVYRPMTLVLDPFLRVLTSIPMRDAEQHNNALSKALSGLPPPDRHAGLTAPAPVLVLPRVFEPAFCKQLIALYETNGGTESGFMRQRDGMTVGLVDPRTKRRKDFNFKQGRAFEPVRAAVRARLVRRLLPEIRKVFQFNVTYIERYVVACYEGSRGRFFRAHRDNTTVGTAHRRFACTINLNPDEYEGGDLWFPEFGPQTYRAPAGGAVVFSCTLLHEARPVTAGTRYAFLPFFYDAAGAQARVENSRFIVDCGGINGKTPVEQLG